MPSALPLVSFQADADAEHPRAVASPPAS